MLKLTKSKEEMSKVDVLNKYHLELLLAFVGELQAIFKCFHSPMASKRWHFG